MRSRKGGLRGSDEIFAGAGDVMDTPTHDRLMLLELATDLQGWSARNLVFRNALDRAARELARMASQTVSN